MLVDQGLSIIAQSIADQFTTGEVGTDNTEPTTADTDLRNGIVATQKAFTTKSSTANLVTLIYELQVSDANGETIREFGTFINDGTNEKLVSRFIHPSINKTDQIALVYRVEYLIERK